MSSLKETNPELYQKKLAALAKGREARKTKLTAKQQKFAEVYSQTLNGTEAARQSYVEAKESTLPNIASTNLTKPNIQNAIRELKQQFVVDSTEVYAIQKDLLRNETTNPELKNKIANKILDRAGFTPVIQTENRSMTAKFIIKRGE